MPMQAWTIYHNGELIDVVFFVSSMTANEVRRSLCDYEGYPPTITVKKKTPIYV